MPKVKYLSRYSDAIAAELLAESKQRYRDYQRGYHRTYRKKLALIKLKLNARASQTQTIPADKTQPRTLPTARPGTPL